MKKHNLRLLHLPKSTKDKELAFVMVLSAQVAFLAKKLKMDPSAIVMTAEFGYERRIKFVLEKK